MRGLLVVERMVLESVAKKKINIPSISKDTNLSELFVRTILSNLKDYGLIKYVKGKYLLLNAIGNFSEVNDPDSLKHEVKDLFNSLVDNHYSEDVSDESLKMQKIWLTDHEFTILKSMMGNIERYIKSIRKDRLLNPEDEILAEQRVIFWGSDTYTNLINTTLKAA